MGDCVWDVGANIGYYTRSFSEKIASNGTVFAFEPSPVNFSELSKECVKLRNVQLLNYGLGIVDCKLSFKQGSDHLGATSRIVDTQSTNTVLVDIRSGVNLVAKKEIMPPQAVKIDVEGFELEVLQGMGELLAMSKLRVIGIEVHFSILKSRGMSDAPRQIECLLEKYGFIVRWLDSSHILATRNS